MSRDTNCKTAPAQLSLDSFLPYRMSVATNLVSDLIASAYRRLFGLAIPEWRLIAVLAERDELNQQRLGEATRMDKLTVSRAAASLVKRELVERRTSERDRRNQLLRLSAEGHRLYEQVAPKALEIEETIFARMTPARRAAFMAMLREVEAAAEAVAAAAAR